MRPSLTARALVPALLCGAPLAAQTPDFHWEKALAAGSTVSLHNLNGDVTVTPSATGKVEIAGIRRGNGRQVENLTLQVVETATGITVCPVFRDVDTECDERGFHIHERRWNQDRWDDARIDMQVRLPRELRLDAHSISGNVSVTGAEGEVRAGSVSGDVRLERLRASGVRASSVSGDVMVRIDQLSGTGELKFTSVSGNVTAELPPGIDADVMMRSVSGSLDSDFPLTISGRMSRNRVEARIGKGGRPLEVTTVSGDVRLRAIK